MATILVPLDGSALAETALPQAQQLAQTLDAAITLLRVLTYREESRRLAFERMSTWDDRQLRPEEFDRQISIAGRIYALRFLELGLANLPAVAASLAL
jgi:nucleotide-binding universal stress UspA family protein